MGANLLPQDLLPSVPVVGVPVPRDSTTSFGATDVRERYRNVDRVLAGNSLITPPRRILTSSPIFTPPPLLNTPSIAALNESDDHLNLDSSYSVLSQPTPLATSSPRITFSDLLAQDISMDAASNHRTTLSELERMVALLPDVPEDGTAVHFELESDTESED